MTRYDQCFKKKSLTHCRKIVLGVKCIFKSEEMWLEQGLNQIVSFQERTFLDFVTFPGNIRDVVGLIVL